MTTTERRSRPVRMTLRVYRVDPVTGTETTILPTREFLSGWAVAAPPPTTGYPPCRCARCLADLPSGRRHATG